MLKYNNVLHHVKPYLLKLLVSKSLCTIFEELDCASIKTANVYIHTWACAFKLIYSSIKCILHVKPIVFPYTNSKQTMPSTERVMSLLINKGNYY